MSRLLVLFFASGGAALIYETVWFYLVQLVVGASSISVAVLLCAFMGGMALGSWLLPRVTPKGTHPFRVVAVLEAGIALLGIAIPLALPYIQRVYLTLAEPGAGSITLRAIVCFLVLTPPTMLMGATLPAIATGTVLAGFYLLRVYDTVVATFIAVTINAIVAAAFWRMAAQALQAPEALHLRHPRHLRHLPSMWRRRCPVLPRSAPKSSGRDSCRCCSAPGRSSACSGLAADHVVPAERARDSRAGICVRRPPLRIRAAAGHDPVGREPSNGVYNGRALCDDFAQSIPYRPSWKLSGTREIGFGVNLSMAFQNNAGPTSAKLMTVVRGSTRYPANCPSPCPAGEVIMPRGVFGQTSLTYNLEPSRATSVERIVQLDFKLSRTFRAGRFSLIPTFEVFNINNSDAIISFITTNVLSSAYRSPNSIMQGRMYGFGAVVRW